MQSRLQAANKQETRESASTSQIALIRHRYVLSLLPVDPAAIEKLRRQSADYAARLQSDGTWQDVDYIDTEINNWKTAEHLGRTLAMAKYARLSRDASHPKPDLESKVLSALKAWTDHDYQDQNWWWNQISVPRRLGEIAALMWPDIPKAELLKVTHIMWRTDRSNPENHVSPGNHPARWTADNMVSRRHVEIVRGLLENDRHTVAKGYDGMYREIKIVGPTLEGIQQDYSFHQHGAQLYNGGYGLGYAVNIGSFVSFASGTRFQIPPDRMAIFSSYLLDGQQWMVWGNIIDYSTMGREITTQPRDSGSHGGRLYGLEQVVTAFAKEPGPRQKEFQTFAARLKAKTDAPAFIGNKQFWCSDFMVHRRKHFYASVKILSNRMVNGEEIDYEGKKSQYLSDGLNYLYLTGNEYRNIFPVWDWSKLPGTTAVQGILQPGKKKIIRAYGTTTFNGGVSDGTYGMAAMDLAHGNLVAKKAWFFFDDSYVALGTGITLSRDPTHPVVTDVNQTLLQSAVFVDQSPHALPSGLHDYDSNNLHWVYQNHVGYIFGPNQRVSVSSGPQTGKWSDISTGSSQPVTHSVFNLWIDHGRSPKGGTYRYIVFPGVSKAQVAERSKHPVADVLSNNQDVQAVYNKDLKLIEATFRKPASLATPIGRIAVDHSCLLMVQESAEGWRISASNPKDYPLTLKVSVNRKQVSIQLPAGRFAGSSVTITCETLTCGF